MILLQNTVLKLEYNPATDILQVKYPNLHSYHMSEIKHNLAIMVENIRNFDVRKLLLDASQTIVEISDADNRQVTMELAAQLAKTRLIKVARVHPVDLKAEVRAQENIQAIQKIIPLPYEIGTFDSVEEALEWLQS